MLISVDVSNCLTIHLFVHAIYSKVVMTGTNVGSETCTGTGKAVLYSNQYFTPTGNITECGVDLADWQAKGFDVRSTVASTPDADTIIGWARETLLGK